MNPMQPGPEPVAIDTTLATVLAVFTVLCACLPGGAVAFMLLQQAKSKAAAGDAIGAQASLRNSYIVSGVSMAIGVPLGILYIMSQASR